MGRKNATMTVIAGNVASNAIMKDGQLFSAKLEKCGNIIDSLLFYYALDLTYKYQIIMLQEWVSIRLF